MSVTALRLNASFVGGFAGARSRVLRLGPLCLAVAWLSGACGEDPPDHATLIAPSSALRACKYESCSSHGSCSAAPEGGPRCSCEVGYAGKSCEACELGYHFDALSECAPDRTCADSATNPCGAYGRCDDSTGVVSCECDAGYEGPRCTLCATGYGRDRYGDCLPLVLGSSGGSFLDPDAAQSTRPDGGSGGDDAGGGTGVDAAVPDAGPPCRDNPIQGRGVMDFEHVDGFPEQPNTCGSLAAITDGKVTLRTAGGDRVVWTCSRNTIYDLSTDHVFVAAGPEGEATLSFVGPVGAVSFDYAARTALDFQLKGDGRLLQKLSAEVRTKGSIAFEFERPIRKITIEGTGSSNQIAIDNIVYTPAACD